MKEDVINFEEIMYKNCPYKNGCDFEAIAQCEEVLGVEPLLEMEK